MRCSAQWRKRHRERVITVGPCLPKQWGKAPPHRQDVPWVVPRSNLLLWQGLLLHGTHQLAWKAGIIFCKRCGMYSENRVRGLLYECILKPSGDRKRNRTLNRIQANCHPGTGEPLRRETDPLCVDERPAWCNESSSDAEEDTGGKPQPSREVPREIPRHTPGASSAPTHHIWPAVSSPADPISGVPVSFGPWPVYRIGPDGEELPPVEDEGGSESD